MKKILFALLIILLLFLTACTGEKTTIKTGEQGEIITTRETAAKETVTIENEQGVNVISFDKAANTATIETHLKINDTTESADNPAFGKVDMAPFLFNIACMGMAQMFNESVLQASDNEVMRKLEGYDLKKVTFILSDEEDGGKIGTCIITAIDKIDCRAHRTYENSLMGMKMCDLSMESIKNVFGIEQ